MKRSITLLTAMLLVSASSTFAQSGSGSPTPTPAPAPLPKLSSSLGELSKGSLILKDYLGTQPKPSLTPAPQAQPTTVPHLRSSPFKIEPLVTPTPAYTKATLALLKPLGPVFDKTKFPKEREVLAKMAKHFPNLLTEYEVFGPSTGHVDELKTKSGTYNCIAWSVGITGNWEWPGETVKEFDAFYRKHGFQADGIVNYDEGIREIRM